MGGGGGGDSVDKAYNARMATISEEQQDWARDFMNFYKHGVNYDPGEEVSGYYGSGGEWVEGDAPPGVTPNAGSETYYDKETDTYKFKEPASPGYEQVTRTRGEIEGYDPNAQASFQQLEGAQIGANMELIGPQKGLALEEIGARRQLLPHATGVAEKYLKEAKQGIDVGKSVNQAGADVTSAFSGALKTHNRNLSRYGIDPSSDRGKSALGATSLSRGRSLAGARSTARTQAIDTNYRRLQDATQIAASAI